MSGHKIQELGSQLAFAGSHTLLRWSAQEFVHSDEGRTVPSLGSLLGCEAEILQLDVAELHMDFLK